MSVEYKIIEITHDELIEAYCECMKNDGNITDGEFIPFTQDDIDEGIELGEPYQLWVNEIEYYDIENMIASDEDGRLVGYLQVKCDKCTHWYLNGELHREDGPAIDEIDGVKRWYLYGRYYPNEQEFKQALFCTKTVNNHENGMNPVEIIPRTSSLSERLRVRN